MIIGIITIFIILLTVSVYIFKYYLDQTIRRRVKDMNVLMEKEISRGTIAEDFFENVNTEKIELASAEGLKIRGIFIEGSTEKSKTAIIVHGITVGIPTSIKYANIFIERGWNVLMYYHRRHGESEGRYSTFGYYEKQDLDMMVNWVVDKVGKDSVIGLHGESMGAATVLQYADINKYVDFIISDCAYSDMDKLLRYELRNSSKIPEFPFINISYRIMKQRAKFDVKDIKPIEAVKNTNIPILFIHGENDKFVPTYMSKEMYEVKKGIKQLYIASGAAHAQSIIVDKEKYSKVINEFIDNIIENE